MKTKILSVVAVIGLSAISAKAQTNTVDYSAAVNFKLTGLVQDDSVESSKGDTTTYNYVVKKVKITNKEILALLAADAGETFPTGAKLVGDIASGDGGNFDVVVADKTGTNILYYPDFYMSQSDVEINSGKSSENSSTYKGSDSGTSTTIGTCSLAVGDDAFDVSGLMVSKYNDSYTDTISKNKGSITANVAGTGNSSVAGGDMILSGSISGSASFTTSN